jgi:c-di-GMP-binding flagellar brake protein YcgR
MSTHPMPLDALASAPEGLDAYRLATPPEIAAMLHRLQKGEIVLSLIAPQGSVCTTTLWTMDAARGALSFAAEADDPTLQALLDGDEAVVVGYLDNIKIQFDIHSLLLVHGERACALSASYPSEIFRFQRRNNFRVRPILRDTPVARLRHPMIPEMQLALRVLDVSLNGCALLLPENVPALVPGVLINDVRIELDLNTHFETALRLQHLTDIQPDSHGVRLGCEMAGLGPEARRTLQRYIDHTQKWRRFMALD